MYIKDLSNLEISSPSILVNEFWTFLFSSEDKGVQNEYNDFYNHYII